MKTLAATFAALALSLGAVSAQAGEGLLAKPSQIPAAARAQLQKEITAERAAHPEFFNAVRNVRGIRPEVYKSFRNPLPQAAIELRSLGKQALLPMLNEIAFDAQQPALTDKEWAALATGLLDAVGVLRDARSGPVLKAVFDGATDAGVQRSAAEAMGRLCGDAELATLSAHTASSDPRSAAAIRGLGQCKRVEAAKQLSTLLASASDDATAELVAGALGIVGSSWAWKALGPQAEASGLATREIAARALVTAFGRYKGDARARIGKSMLLVEHPVLPVLLAKARATAPADVAAEMLRIEKLLTR